MKHNETRIIRKFIFLPIIVNKLFVWLKYVYIKQILTGENTPKWEFLSYSTKEQYVKSKNVTTNYYDNIITQFIEYLHEYKSELNRLHKSNDIQMNVFVLNEPKYDTNKTSTIPHVTVVDLSNIDVLKKFLENNIIPYYYSTFYLHIIFVFNKYNYGQYSYECNLKRLCVVNKPSFDHTLLTNAYGHMIPDASVIFDNINTHQKYINVIDNVFNEKNNLPNSSYNYKDCIQNYNHIYSTNRLLGCSLPSYNGYYIESFSHFINFEYQMHRFDKLDFCTYNLNEKYIKFNFNHTITEKILLSKINNIRDYVKKLFESEQRLIYDNLSKIYMLKYADNHTTIIYTKDSTLTDKQLVYIDVFTGLKYYINIGENIIGIVEDTLASNKQTLLSPSHAIFYGDNYFTDSLISNIDNFHMLENKNMYNNPYTHYTKYRRIL